MLDKILYHHKCVFQDIEHNTTSLTTIQLGCYRVPHALTRVPHGCASVQLGGLVRIVHFEHQNDMTYIMGDMFLKDFEHW